MARKDYEVGDKVCVTGNSVYGFPLRGLYGTVIAIAINGLTKVKIYGGRCHWVDNKLIKKRTI